MNADDADRNIFTFVRRDDSGKKNLLFILNMSPMKWENYLVPVPKVGEYKLVLNSDEDRFGGFGTSAPEKILSEKQHLVLQENTIKLDVHPYSALVYTF